VVVAAEVAEAAAAEACAEVAEAAAVEACVVVAEAAAVEACVVQEGAVLRAERAAAVAEL
jgi:hypothetical protein